MKVNFLHLHEHYLNIQRIKELATFINYYKLPFIGLFITYNFHWKPYKSNQKLRLSTRHLSKRLHKWTRSTRDTWKDLTLSQRLLLDLWLSESHWSNLHCWDMYSSCFCREQYIGKLKMHKHKILKAQGVGAPLSMMKFRKEYTTKVTKQCI